MVFSGDSTLLVFVNKQSQLVLLIGPYFTCQLVFLVLKSSEDRTNSIPFEIISTHRTNRFKEGYEESHFYPFENPVAYPDF